MDHLEGESQIKLAKRDPASGGLHHYLAIADVESIDADGALVLKISSEDVKRIWASP